MIDNARELIFPVFLVPMKGGEPQLDSRAFLGTGFFVSRQGDAITAAHILPKPERVEADTWVAAVVVRDGKEVLCRVGFGLNCYAWDLALMRVALGPANTTKHLEIAGAETPAGTDVEVIGVPEHEVWNNGKEMRMLKGHVSMTRKPWLELSCPIPPGMSGSPVFAGGRVVGCAVGAFRTEQVEDSTEEVLEVIGGQERLRQTVVRRVFQYGKALSFFAAKSESLPGLDDKTLLAFIADRNKE